VTIGLTGKVALNANINNEFHRGNLMSSYRGVKYYKPSTTTIGYFDSTNLNFSEFRGTQNGISINITIAADTQNYVLSPSNASVSPTYVSGFTSITVTINSGIYVGSSSTGTYAFTVSGFASGDKINIINNGFIIGAGGAGGASHSNASGSPGNAGGNALNLSYATYITNNGTIAGGGGGGGAADGGTTYGSCLGGGSSYTGQGGGGGAGYTVGAGGSGSPNGSAGTRTAGGAGAATGGGPGLAGGTSGNGRAGGAAGSYIVGASYANWIVTGTRLGGSS
jgi:hypothetical protein